MQSGVGAVETLLAWTIWAILMGFLLLSTANMVCRIYFREKERFVDRLVEKQEKGTNGEDN